MKKWIVLCVACSFSRPLWAADIPALLQWSHRVELSTPVSGVVQAVHADAGDRVKKGQVLLTLDSTSYRAKVSENLAEIFRLDAEEKEASRDLDRVQELYNRTVVATFELDQARLRLVNDQARLAEAQARLKQNRKALDDCVMRAPFAAVVILRQVEPGQSVAAGLQPQTLLVLARAGEMIARMYLAPAQMENLKTGNTVTVAVGAQNYTGKIKTLGLEPVKIKDEPAYPVDVAFPVGEQLRAGTAAVVKLP